MASNFPTEASARKNLPLVRGCLDYFPAALVAVAELSRIANEQHNPGEAIHWARDKSTDHADCLVRHLIDRGLVDDDGIRHTTKVAWRALALLQEELEAAGMPISRASTPAAPDALSEYDDQEIWEEANNRGLIEPRIGGEY